MSNFLRTMFVLCGMFVLWVQNASATVQNTDGSIDCTAAIDTQFVPSWGKVYVGQDQYSKYIIQYMYWHDVARLQWFKDNPDSTFEPDAFFGGPTNGETPYGYMKRDVWYGDPSNFGYWSSNMLAAYQDTDWQKPFQNSPEWAVTVGTAQAASLLPQVVFSTVTRMFDGGVASGKVKLSSQRGRRAFPVVPFLPVAATYLPIDPYGKWNSYGCQQEPNNIFTLPWGAGFTAPGCRQYNYLWDITSNRAC